jgi:hypothetical protein
MNPNSLAFGASLMAGILQGQKEAREQALSDEFKKVLMDKHKAEGKLLEANINKENFIQQLIKQGGGPSGSSPPPNVALGEPGGQPVSQIMAQGQLNEIYPGSGVSVTDVINKKYFNIDPRPVQTKMVGDNVLFYDHRGQPLFQIPGTGKYELKEQHTPQGVVAVPVWVPPTPPIPGIRIRDPQSMQGAPGPAPAPTGGGGMPLPNFPRDNIFPSTQKVPTGPGAPGAVLRPPPSKYVETRDAKGAPSLRAVPENPPVGTEIPTGPGAGEAVTEASPELRKTLDGIDLGLKRLADLEKYASSPNAANLFGYLASKRHVAMQTPDTIGGAAMRGAFAVADRFTGQKYTPDLTTFHSKLEDFTSTLRHERFGGALTVGEVEKWIRQALSATTPEQFLAVAKGMREIYLMQRGITVDSIVKSPKERAMGKITPRTPDEFLKDIGAK